MEWPEVLIGPEWGQAWAELPVLFFPMGTAAPCQRAYVTAPANSQGSAKGEGSAQC